jgi:glycosyltransferase involved in cell wall biosynthesis
MSKNELPLVSVAIVTYNQREYLREAVESVLLQDYPNIEIVIADDGSTDGTHELAKEYSNKFPGRFVLVLSDINRGITANSNAAHFACSGKYISCLAGDDLMLPSKIRKQVEILELHGDCNIVCHNLEVFDSLHRKKPYLFNKKWKHNVNDVILLIKEGAINGACSNMIRKSAAPINGFNVELRVASDWLFWVDCLKDGGKIYYIDEVLGKYRMHANNVTNIKSSMREIAINDHLRTCDILQTQYPNLKKMIDERRSVLYRAGRHIRYFEYLKLSVHYDVMNVKSIALLFVFILTFGNVKK